MALPIHKSHTFIPDPTPVSGAHYDVLNVKVLNVAHTPANDNYIPYRQAQFFINRSDPAKDSFISEWGVSFFERTPLMGAVTANYLNLFPSHVPIGYAWNKDSLDPRHTYLQFQLLASILNSLYIVPAFYLLRLLFNKRTALVTCLFLIVSQFFLYNAIFSWPKSLVAFFVLTAWLLVLSKKTTADAIVAGAVFGVAYLTHDLALLYLGATILYLLYTRRFADVALISIPPALLALCWLVVAKHYAQPSSFMYYPLSIKGLPPVDGKDVVHRFLHTNPFYILYIRLYNLFYLLTPYQLFASQIGQTIARRIWAVGLYSLPGATGLALIVPAILAFFKRLANWRLIIFIFGPFIGETLLIGWPQGLGALHFAEASVVLLSGFAIHYLLQLADRRWLFAAFVGQVAILIYFILFSYDFPYSLWMHSIHAGEILATMSVVITFVGWMVYVSATHTSLQDFSN